MSSINQASKSVDETKVMEPAARMKELIGMSHNIAVDRNISIDKYFKSGRELIKSAAAFEQAGDIEKAFILYLRYMTLFIEKITQHPEYSKADKQEKALVKSECNNVFDLAENLKKEIMNKYTLEYEQHKQDKTRLGLSVGDHVIEKRAIQSSKSAPRECDMDEIDKKFNFSQHELKEYTEKGFDPFNIEELKKSFNVTKD